MFRFTVLDVTWGLCLGCGGCCVGLILFLAFRFDLVCGGLEVLGVLGLAFGMCGVFCLVGIRLGFVGVVWLCELFGLLFFFVACCGCELVVLVFCLGD